MIGPITLVAAGPDEWGFVKTRTAIDEAVGWAYAPSILLYPIAVIDPECELTVTKDLLKRLQTYRYDWMSLRDVEN